MDTPSPLRIHLYPPSHIARRAGRSLHWPARRAEPGWRWCGYPGPAGRGRGGGADRGPAAAAPRQFCAASAGRVLDRPGLVLWFPGPESFTGEDVAEFQFMAVARCARPCSRRFWRWACGRPSRGNSAAGRWKMAARPDPGRSRGRSDGRRDPGPAAPGLAPV